MQSMKDAWTDGRLDDLNDRVGDMGRRMDEGFNRVREDLQSLRVEVDAKIDSLRVGTKSEIGAMRGDMKTEIGSLRGEMKTEIGSLRSEVKSEIGSLHRLTLQVGGSMFATFAVGFVGLIATQL